MNYYLTSYKKNKNKKYYFICNKILIGTRNRLKSKP